MRVNEQFKYLNIGLPDRIARKKTFGDFQGAVRMIDDELAAGKGSPAYQACLRVQRELILRLARDYPYTFEEAVAFAQKSVPDFTPQEMEELERTGRVDWIYINGVPHYFNRFLENLFETDHSYLKRAGILPQGGDPDNFARRHALFEEQREKGSVAHRIRVKATLRMNDDVFHPGVRVLAHLPIPADCAEQSDIRIERVFPETGSPDREDAPQRTISWQEVMTENHPFEVEYSYIYRARFTDAWNARADAEQPDFFTGEQAPHIMFTPYIRDLTAMLTEGTADNLEKARRIYDFVTQNVKYSFSRIYFGLESIAETCARNLVGDCGIQTLLFITLCRCAGVPARWESGLAVGPDATGAHDWCKVYAAPLGWFPVDLSRGGSAFARGDETLRQYYFGNLEGDRMVANREFQTEFGVPKEHWRCDPYDNQLGEMETEDRGLLYDEFVRSKELLAYEKL